MPASSGFAHKIFNLSHKRRHDIFLNSLKSPKEAQLSILNKMRNKSNRFDNLDDKPITNYSDYESLISKNESHSKLSNEKVSRYEPTSGSGGPRKWIPYTPDYLSALDAAASPWLFDLYKSYPGVRRGKHYWSLSWSNEEEDLQDDTELLPWYKRWFLRQILVLTQRFKEEKSRESFMRKSLKELIESRDLSLISVWSPSFITSLLDILSEEISWIHDAVENPIQKKHLKNWNGEQSESICTQLWPEMALISCWDTGPSKKWVKSIKQFFPDTSVQGKGLWATEGVVTIPFQGHYPLAIESHYYEFYCPNTEKIYKPWELEKDQVVQPLLTLQNGFIRYNLEDNVRVCDFLYKTPCLEFLGRSKTIDFVGEKVDSEFVQVLFKKIESQHNNFSCVSVLGVEAEKPFYVLLGQSDPKYSNTKVLEDFKSELNHLYHYELARNLNQLDESQIVCEEEALKKYLNYKRSKVQVEGDIKVEPLELIGEREYIEFFTTGRR